ncbi:ABC transporter substrate-binding protein [Alicyclobacillus sp. ALC3]|uniref:ABC transporter substrate-binding protein n=1 Tax=Alicyclobacillus sp. ALC3 TaxID=2796143 RepID=UPI002379D854|nr:ABC transporter substrate-binding protein [Alicyclobacillus sp. ALC3]WDL99098.1 ABC transporter substrate-binding protein [Alicyclobacillus sp. ALC3]
MNKHVLSSLLLGSALVVAVAGCGTTSQTSGGTGSSGNSAGKGTSSSSASGALPVQIPMSTLVANAKKEGVVHGFGMPANWANLGGMWSSFSKKYGIQTVYQAEGNMTSAEELQAFQKEKNHSIGDVGDIGIQFGPTAQQMGVVAPFKNQYWNQIPSQLKDPNGTWAAAYYGVMSFEVNTNKVKNVPKTWSDLLKPEYKGMIGFGDPRQAAENFDAVIAAAYAFGGSSQNIQPGIQFFQKLRKSGNWTGTPDGTSVLQTGQAAIEIRWNYLAEADQQAFKGHPNIQIVVPSDSTVAGPYVEVVNKYAPHPYAARLLNDYLFSDAGQISYAEGGAYPVRLKYLKLPSSVHLPPLNMNSVHFLVGNFTNAVNQMNSLWGKDVLGQ